MIYHGVLTSCNGFVYSFGAARLDLDEPWKVIYRGEPYLLAPQAPYERTGYEYGQGLDARPRYRSLGMECWWSDFGSL